MFDTALRRGSGWRAAHEALTRLARNRAELDFEEGEKLRAAERARVHERLGYGSFVEKGASGGLNFWHADGTAYGGRPNTGEADTMAQTFRGLRNLGFGEREARDAVRAAAAHVGSEGGVEGLMRSALERLTRNSWEKAS